MKITVKHALILSADPESKCSVTGIWTIATRTPAIHVVRIFQIKAPLQATISAQISSKLARK